MYRHVTIIILVILGTFLLLEDCESKTINTTLHGYINHSVSRKLVDDLNSAQEGDKVYIEINSLGGIVFFRDQIIRAIFLSKGEVYCTVTFYAASAAADILTRCPNQYAYDDAKILFHVSRIRLESGETKKATCKKIISPLCYYYISDMLEFKQIRYAFNKDEWENLKNGGDVIITGKKYMERLRNRK